jgi:hypothetical protein
MRPAYNVSIYYQILAYMDAFGVIDKRLAILPHHYRVAKTWSAVKPYVESERLIRGDYYSFLNFFEDFAVMCERESLKDLYLCVRRREFERRRWWPRPSRDSWLTAFRTRRAQAP